MRDRSFDLQAALNQARAGSTVQERTTRFGTIRALVQQDQAELAQVIAPFGGVLERGFWVLNALAVDVPPAALPALRAHRRVERLVRMTAVGPADAALDPLGSTPSWMLPLPIGSSTNALNHNVAGARSILTQGGLSQSVANGAGVTFAIFDTGIDADADGAGLADPTHPCFRPPGGGAMSTRILAHLRANPSAIWDATIDCNNITYGRMTNWTGSPGTYPVAFDPCNHSLQAPHGTAMAGIAVGNAGAGLPEGHAPEASIVDVAFTRPSVPGNAREFWQVVDADYLAAIEALEQFIITTQNPVHVLNISFDAWSEVDHPVTLALDSLARRQDILIVANCGNIGDETRVSNGSYHGLAVGAVHARTDEPPANLSFVPMFQSSRGPLNSNWNRLYPDVCATGAGPGTVQLGTRRFWYPLAQGFGNSGVQATMLQMPNVDVFDPAVMQGGCNYPAGSIRYNYGTSEAAAQVSGAATLYRAARQALGGASAEEARAAILLNVLGTYAQPDGQTPAVFADQHTYRNRNTFGVGYVRDDLLAEFAIRAPAIQPLAQIAVLAPGAGPVDVSYGPLVAGQRYAVVACWRRIQNMNFDSSFPELGLPDVNLEVWNSTLTTRLASSATPANSYERLVFRAPAGGGSVWLRLVLNGVAAQNVPVQLVARLLASDTDPATPDPGDAVHASSGRVESLGAGAACAAMARDLEIERVVPAAYADAYGSQAFLPTLPPGTPLYFLHAGYVGRDLGVARDSTSRRIHIQICDSEMGAGDFNIGGLAFRTWAPFDIAGPLQIATVEMEVVSPGTTTPTTGLGGTLRRVPPANGLGIVASNVTLPDLRPRAAELGFDRYPIIIPFDNLVTYQRAPTADLHIWLTLANSGSGSPTYQVDAANDGAGGYGMRYDTSPSQPGGAQVIELVGATPVIGLLGAPVVAMRQPRLQVFGEPWIGQSLELQLSRAPASTFAFLIFGGWAPGTQAPCASHLASPTVWASDFTNAAGWVRFTLAVPNAANLVHTEFGLQASTNLFPFSNGLRIHVGGGL